MKISSAPNLTPSPKLFLGGFSEAVPPGSCKNQTIQATVSAVPGAEGEKDTGNGTKKTGRGEILK